MVLGAGGSFVGGGMSTTGGGALVGVPIAVASAGMLVNGYAAVGVGIDGLTQAWSEGSGAGSGGAAPSTPAASGIPKAVPAPRVRGNPNPIGERGTFYVDPKGNVVPTPPGGRITGSPDGRFVQARDQP